jgi:selenocysteine-specific elongation factor
VFSIRGAGTVVTGTLTGGPLRVGDEVEISPTGRRARVRGLQSHKRSLEAAFPVARVAVNLVGVEREDLERGDVLGLPGQWRPTSVIEARVRPVRGLDHPVSGRGAFKLYVGSAERDARIRFHGTGGLRQDRPEGELARIRLSAPVVVEPGDRFVLRESGRRATVAGGVVLDPEPPTRPGPDVAERLGRREATIGGDIPSALVAERGAIRATDLTALTGRAPASIDGAVRSGPWWVGMAVLDEVRSAVAAALEAFHRDHPLLAGADVSVARAAAAGVAERLTRRPDPGVVDAALDALVAEGLLAREGSEVRLASHRAALDERGEELDRLVRAVSEGEPSPPTVSELAAAGFSRDVVEAAARAGRLVRVSPDLVLTHEFVGRARQAVDDAGSDGITVSAFRERLGTSRKYAVPLLEWFDQRGVTRRRGDLRFLRERRD